MRPKSTRARSLANGGDWEGALATWQDVVREGMRVEAEMWAVVYNACQAAGREEESNLLVEYGEREGIPMMAMAEVAGGGGEGEGE